MVDLLETLYLSSRFYDYFCEEYGSMSNYVKQVHGRTLMAEKRVSDEVTELTIGGPSLPLLCNGKGVLR